VTDRKLAVDDGTGEVDYYVADVVSQSDYFPFGMVMPGRNDPGTNDYRYGFQGEETDKEIKGEGNSINYKYRMHDPRIGRFFAVDPLTSKYPHNSPYAFSENRVIDGVELEGLEVYTGVTQAQFLNDLNKIISAPEIMDQASTSWCGATCAVYLAAKLDPAGFRQNAIDLYNNGFVEGGSWTLDLDASNDTYSETPSSIQQQTGINNTAQFITTAAFKNNYLPLNGLGTDLDEGDYTTEFWGITYAEDFVDYLTTYNNITYTEGDGKFDGLLYDPFDLADWDPVGGIDKLSKAGNTVQLIVDSNALNGGKGDVTTQHYITVEKMTKITTGNTTKYKIEYYDPAQGKIDDKTFSEDKWEEVINWYGGFK